MPITGRWRILAYLVPGFLCCAAALAWTSFFVPDPIAKRWREPGQTLGKFDRWSIEDRVLRGRTESHPHKDSRANAFLISRGRYRGDVEVRMRVRFLPLGDGVGRYLGCYLCYDPVAGDGYWLSTGHAVGKYPGKAYVKSVRDGRWRTEAREDLEIEQGREYEIAFRRSGGTIAVVVDGREAVSWKDDAFRQGFLQLRLHNSAVEIRELEILGRMIDERRERERVGGTSRRGAKTDMLALWGQSSSPKPVAEES